MNGTGGTTILFIVSLILIIAVIAILFYIPASMAEKRGRSVLGWFIFSLLFSPLLAIIFLACMGETDKKRLKRIQEEEELRLSIRLKNNE